MDKLTGFLNYAKSKKWDASLIVYNGEYQAIINPITTPKLYEGHSHESIEDAIDKCKQRLIEGANNE